MRFNVFKPFMALSFLFFLSGCSTTPYYKPSPSWDIASAEFSAGNALYSAPKIDTTKRKYGNPYTVLGKTYTPLKSSEGYRRKGVASWYGKDFHGKKTANGEQYNMYAMTAAHPTLPLPTFVRVTNLENGLSVVVRVNDRGPFLRGRIIDLSYKAAQKLKMDHQGTAPVLLEALPTDGSALNVSKPIWHHLKQDNQPSLNVEKQEKASKPSLKKTQQRWTDRYARKNNSSPSKYLEKELPVAIKNTHTVNEGVNMQPNTPVHLGVPVTIYVQTGAFSKASNALKEREKLKNIYPSITIQEVWAVDKVLHRVRLGPLDTISEADTLLKKAIDAGWSGAKISIDD